MCQVSTGKGSVKIQQISFGKKLGKFIGIEFLVKYMTLTKTLQQEIRRHYPNLCELNRLYALKGKHKEGTVDRILRKIAEDKSYKPVKNDKNHITGYKYLHEPKQSAMFTMPHYI